MPLLYLSAVCRSGVPSSRAARLQPVAIKAESSPLGRRPSTALVSVTRPHSSNVELERYKRQAGALRRLVLPPSFPVLCSMCFAALAGRVAVPAGRSSKARNLRSGKGWVAGQRNQVAACCNPKLGKEITVITRFYATEDGRKFASEFKAVRHQRRMEAVRELNNLLLSAPLIEQAETMDVAFEDQFAEWLLSEPTRVAFLEILRMVEQDVLQCDRAPEGKSKRDSQRVGGTPSGATQADMVGNATRDFRTTKE